MMLDNYSELRCNRERYYCPNLQSSDTPPTEPADLRVPTDELPYNLVSSKIVNSDLHAPALDIDIPCRFVPSSTEGHGHLYFDSLRLSWPKYRMLLDVLADVGILAPEYVEHSRRVEQTLLRPPHIKKEASV